ncbi:hypothetical protein EYF80_053260 [Liparis tanakae]|uniref:Ig-like domain-containing protein n=1 Tax=Liparis tanakae TaxID=230148 RepID=A0A4Z2F6T6_9TELE|nr:hypothetical protein EYF80_053260 [Liparis tanakae]
MRKGEDTDWFYSISLEGKRSPPNSPKKRFKSQSLTSRHSERPKARLSKDTPAGGSLSLTCSVSSSSPSSSGWKYFWYRGKKTSEPLITREDVLLPNGGGGGGGGGEFYWCRGGSGDPVYYTEYSNTVATHTAVVTLQPDWPELYSGEAITLTCAVRDGGDAEWEYRWEIFNSHGPHKLSGAVITPSHGGDFWCRGRLRYETSSSEWSEAFTLKVSPGWRFFWYRVVPSLPGFYSRELLPSSTNGTERDSYTVHGHARTAGYACRAARGDPVFRSSSSEPQFVWSAGSFRRDVITVVTRLTLNF